MRPSTTQVFRPAKSFFELVAQDAKAFGRERLSIPFCLMALLGLNKFSAVLLHRVGSALFDKGFPCSALAKLAGRWNCLCNSCELSPHARIGPGLLIPHPIGIVVGAIRAGKNLIILQNAGIGLKEWGRPSHDHRRYPCLGDNVTIGPSASVLGSVVIGDGVLIGANAVVLKDIPPGCRAVGNPARVLPARSGLGDHVSPQGAQTPQPER
jgi:serine O-acetyltransferase